jgi:predicted transcriptional regulator
MTSNTTGNPIVDDLVTQLRQRRRDLGIGQRTLAELTGISHAHISRIEGGHVTPLLSTLTRITEALDAKLQCQIIPNQHPEGSH